MFLLDTFIGVVYLLELKCKEQSTLVKSKAESGY